MNFSRLRLPILFCALPTVGVLGASGAVLKGKVFDADTKEPLIGVTLMVAGQKKGTVTDAEGGFLLNLAKGKYTLKVKCVGYKDGEVPVVMNRDTVEREVSLMSSDDSLAELVVVANVRKDTETAQIQEQKQSAVVQNGVSAQQVEKTQDKDASEVIRRIPGISIIEDKFVMVRGLAQRYNNVWLNGGAVPSSEADSRAFSFDIIPSSQLDNITVIKSPAPEYPSDFAGGFILVNTRRQPGKNAFNIGVGTGWNTLTHFKEFIAADGFSPFPGSLKTYGGTTDKVDVLNNGFNNEWRVKTFKPLADLKLNGSWTAEWVTENGTRLDLLASANYSRGYKTVLNMENSLFGPYDVGNGKSVPLRKGVDNQYTNDSRCGAMLNLMLATPSGNHTYDWKNLFNCDIKDRYSDRTGFNAQADNINDMEYYHSKRPTFNTQFTGKHSLAAGRLDWSVGYSFARKDLPDRRLIQRTDRTEQTMGIYRISREFTRLDENIGSASVNYSRDMDWGIIAPTLKGGLYGDYRNRRYDTRSFQYGWNPENSLPKGFMFNPDVQGSVLTAANYGADKLYMYEEVNFLNNYKGREALGAGYVSLNIPLGKFSVYAGLRYEFCRKVLDMNTRQFEESLKSSFYDYSDLFPSVNAVYRLTDSNQIRFAYGRSVNRPEFRELSPSVYYDFDLGSNVMGNYDLKAAYIDNLDLRYEYYPTKGEQISLSLFYKRFKNPIEWTYTVAGGTDLIYSFVNANGADNYGVELDVRKSFDFIGLPNWSVSFNGSLIKSEVRFDKGSNNLDRPMQGQSPYLINTGIFYATPKSGWNVAVLYNRIGRRIIGVGNKYGTAADGTALNIPNSYEMPRNSLDLSVSKKLGNWTLKGSVRDILAEKVEFRQIEEVLKTRSGGYVDEVTRSFRPGRNISVSVSYEFK